MDRRYLSVVSIYLNNNNNNKYELFNYQQVLLTEKKYISYFRGKVTRAWIGLYKEQHTNWIWPDVPVNYTNASLTDDDPTDYVVWAGLVTAGPIGRWEHDDISKEHHFICQRIKCEIICWAL